MVYISPDGKVLQNQPWSIQRVTNMFWGCVAFVILFFKTLVGLDTNGSGKPGRGGSSGGSGGPGNGPGGKGPRIGRITTIQDCSMPGGG